ncbi:hypothetical protein BGZ68_006459, partial [Mortierella alpina]
MEEEERLEPTVHNCFIMDANAMAKSVGDGSADTQGLHDVIGNLSVDALNMNLHSKLPQVRIESEAIVVSTEHHNPSDHVSTIDPDLLPINWPKHVKYLVDYEYHPSIPPSILDLVQGRRRQRTRSRLEQTSAIGSGVAADMSAEGEQEEEKVKEEEEDEQELSRSELELLGSYGLFATRTLFPGLHLLDYISLVVPDDYADPDSDHTLYLSNDLNLDASVHGNHGRFVNDFRKIRTQEQGPNVGWDLYRDAETGQIRMGCKVLKRIKKGEEILCTYGKAYWKSRGVMVTGQ